MFELITKKISNKIIIALFVLMSLSSITVIFVTTNKVTENSIVKTKENLEMLNAAMFQSLRNAMNTGDPIQIAKAEDDARQIKGVKDLTVAKSKALMELYPSDTTFTKDSEIIETFNSKEPLLIQSKDENGHTLRMIKPMIATTDCLLCHANQSEGDVIGVMDLTFSLDESDSQIKSLVTEISIISIILAILTISLIFFIVKKATNPIGKLKDGFENLLHSNDTNISLSVESKDEIGEVANLFNAYMDKVRAGLKQDEKVIEEASDILEKTGNGFFVYKVNSKASNPHVEDLKNKLNSMILSTKETLDKINETLRFYAESKYDFKIEDDGIYGNLGSLTAGIKLVGNNTSEILAMVMNTGEALNSNTHTLSNASNNLSASSNQQAASLEETAAALEQITATIQANTQATNRMSQLAQNVTTSAQNGQNLANQTAKSMDDINTQVSSINVAIEVIDQIAFQTNILSLNAAVEAATAGEAGRGFAVVAAEVRNLANRSAQAAKEIKNIVELASKKAQDGKEISDNMIHGYTELNENISNTIETINEVARASKEQERGIVQINDAINTLDQATQKNAQVADEISIMATNIANMSNSLVSAASKASFIEDARDKVGDVELVYDTAQLKVDLLNTKDLVYSRLGEYKSFEIEKNTSLKRWCDNHTISGKKIDNELMSQIDKLNLEFHENLQKLVDANSNKEENSSLNQKSKDVEMNTLRIFGNLNNVKREACKK
jgi:methyl-accepting chemotaxis protein